MDQEFKKRCNLIAHWYGQTCFAESLLKIGLSENVNSRNVQKAILTIHDADAETNEQRELWIRQKTETEESQY